MFQIGKKKKREPMTEETRQAYKEVRQAAALLKMKPDHIAQMFGHKTFNSLSAIPDHATKIIRIAEVFRNLKRLRTF